MAASDINMMQNNAMEQRYSLNFGLENAGKHWNFCHELKNEIV